MELTEVIFEAGELGWENFLEALEMGLPRVFYKGYICPCGSELGENYNDGEGSERARGHLRLSLGRSQSEVVGLYNCEGEEEIIEEAGKRFERPSTRYMSSDEISEFYRLSKESRERERRTF